MATPYEVFTITMGRVDGLLRLHPVLHGIAGRPRQHVSDVMRGALVLSVAALDALVLDSVVAAIPTAVRDQRLGPNVAKWVKEDPETFLTFLGDPQAAQKLSDLCRAKLGQITFQKVAMIEGVMYDVVRRGQPWTRAADILTAGGAGNWDSNAVRVKLDEIVERRHRIAHSGDMRPSSTATQPIQLPYVQEAARVIKAVGQAVTKRSAKLSNPPRDANGQHAALLFRALPASSSDRHLAPPRTCLRGRWGCSNTPVAALCISGSRWPS